MIECVIKDSKNGLTRFLRLESAIFKTVPRELSFKSISLGIYSINNKWLKFLFYELKERKLVGY